MMILLDKCCFKIYFHFGTAINCYRLAYIVLHRQLSAGYANIIQNHQPLILENVDIAIGRLLLLCCSSIYYFVGPIFVASHCWLITCIYGKCKYDYEALRLPQGETKFLAYYIGRRNYENNDTTKITTKYKIVSRFCIHIV